MLDTYPPFEMCPRDRIKPTNAKLRGPVAYLYFSLYVILDLFSRYVVGWMVC